MLSVTYYAQNYAGIIAGLVPSFKNSLLLTVLNIQFCILLSGAVTLDRSEIYWETGPTIKIYVPTINSLTSVTTPLVYFCNYLPYSAKLWQWKSVTKIDESAFQKVWRAKRWRIELDFRSHQ